MLKFGDKTVGSIPVNIFITENDIETIIVNGFEGGIGYWAGLDNKGDEWKNKPADEPTSMWTTKLILEGKSVTLYDRENPEEKAELTLEKLIKGIKLNYDNRSWDRSIEDGDAETYDCIIQYALFDSIVYG